MRKLAAALILFALFLSAHAQRKAKTAVDDYKPAVEISTSTENGSVLVKVKDNGNGIPDDIKDKIMQSFFTTKPTGEGAGLGLSLAYDIVKAHGGELKVGTNDSGGAVFIIQISTDKTI